MNVAMAFGADIVNCTVTENSSNFGSGMYGSSSNPPNVGNTIIANNTNWGDVYGDFQTLGHNLIGYMGAATTGFVDGVNGDIVGDGATPPIRFSAPSRTMAA